MRRFGISCLLLLATCVYSGCGNASSIEEGIPKNVEVPKDFDPGGDAVPDMKGTGAAKK